MAFFPSFSYRQNLEACGDVRSAGAWQIVPLLDPVRERHFLGLSLKHRAVNELQRSVLTFRAESAAILAPGVCPDVLSTSVDGDRLELLTAHFDPISRNRPDADAELIFDVLIRTLDKFERHGLLISELPLASLGRDPSGHLIILPSAYVLPGQVGTASGRRHDIDGGTDPLSADTRCISETGTAHLPVLRRLVGEWVAENARTGRASRLRQRLEEMVAAVARGDVSTLAGAYEAVLGRSWDEPGQPAERRTKRAPHPNTEKLVTAITERAIEDGAVVVVRGKAGSGMTRLLRTAAAALQHAGGSAVMILDAWDLFSTARSRKIARGRTPVRCIWVIDDIAEMALADSSLALAMLESDATPKGSVILGYRSDGDNPVGAEFLHRLREKRAGRYHDIDTPGTSGVSPLAPILRTAGIPGAPGNASDSTRDARTLLDALRPDERQLLEFLSVARFAMPFDVIHTVFPESDRVIAAAVLRLSAIQCIEIYYRRVGPKHSLSLFFRVRDTAVRHAIYNALPKDRQERLHRTVALVGEQYGAFPTYFLLVHGLACGDDDLAARHALTYLRDTKQGKRHPNVVSLCVDLVTHGRLDGTLFADRIFARHELSGELLRLGRTADAEKILIKSLDLIEPAGSEQKLKNAPLLSATYRLLADRWEARGEFRRALDLLETARDELQSALPIVDQAQLLNDLGWLQYRLGDYERSMESCRLSLNTLNANQYPLIVAQALNLVGVVHFNTSRYDEAISYYEQSAYLRERSGDENALAASYNNLALAYQSKGDYDKSLSYHNKSLELKRHQNNEVGIAGGYLNLALLYLETRNFREAEAKCRESLAIGEKLENAQLVADNYITLGDIAREGGDLETAEAHYCVSQRISHERAAINEEMGASRRLSALCVKQKRIEEARRHAEAAFALVQRIGSRYEDAQIEDILGDIELEENRQMEALKHYERAATQYTALSKYRLGTSVLSKIGLIHADTGNTLEARAYLDRAQDFVRADIGRELPDEFVRLQHVFRAHPERAPIAGKEAQRLLMALYDLSAVTDYAADPREFFRKLMEVTGQIADPVGAYLALKTGSGRFLVIDAAGGRNPGLSPRFEMLFNRTLALGGLVDGQSQDISDIAADLAMHGAAVPLCIPLKSMGDDVGCILFYLDAGRFPLTKEDVNFFTWLGRQTAANLKMMLHLNESFLKEEILGVGTETHRGGRSDKHEFQALIGKSEAMKKIFRMLDRVKGTDSGILILGESGTGKSALARATHYGSPRRNHPFQEIHCAQIPHNLLESELFGHERGSFTGAVQRKLGLCEVADGGTLFLDDINVMPVETQTKLLHFIENKTFMRLGGTRRLSADVRIIAASNENLESLCKEGRFREDLYYRLKVILIDLPPLRERKEDMLAIALDYIKRSCAKKGLPPRTLSPEAVALLQKAQWRGNVRELQNVLERVLVLSDDKLITPSSLPEDFLKEVAGTSRQSSQRLDELVDEIVRLGTYSESNPLLPVLEAALARRMVVHAESKNRAAAMLGISKPTLYARLRDYDRMH